MVWRVLSEIYSIKVSHFFVQNENSKQLLKSIEINTVTISGDTRFDRVADIAFNSIEFPIISSFVQNNKIFIGGSTWNKDNELIVDLINSQELKKM